MAIIILFGTLRYFFLDGSDAKFFNLFNPLKYRLVEVLMLVFSMSVALGLYFAEKNNKKIYGTYVIIHFCGIVLTGSRTGYIVTGMLGIIVLCFQDFNTNFFKKVLLFIGMCVPMIFITSADEKVAENFHKLSMVKHYITLDFDKAVENDEVVRRIGMILGTKEIIVKNPLLGVGLGKENFFMSFPEYYLNYFHVGRPHNQYLSIGSTSGFLGLFAFLLFLYTSLKLGFKTFKITNKYNIKNCCLKYLFISNLLILVLMIGYEFETTPFIWVIWSFCASSYAIKNKESKFFQT